MPNIITRRRYPWRLSLNRLAASANIVLTSPATGGGYARLGSFSPIYLSNLWDDAPDYVTLTPVGEQVQANQNIKFGIYVFRGKHTNLDRICLVSAVVGTYKVSALAPLPGQNSENRHATAAAYPLSTLYVDTMTLTNNYGHTITKYDAAGGNGKGSLIFDVNGGDILVPALISTIATSGKLSFELAGYDG